MNTEKDKKVSSQKFKWSRKQTFNNYQNASALKNELIESGYEYVKIRRCGPGGELFKVVDGTLVKANKKVNNKNHNKKENTNAN